MKDIRVNISLLCPVCGNDQFTSIDGEFRSAEEIPLDARYKCSDCGTIFTKEEIIKENAEKIDIASSEICLEVTNEFEKELKKIMKKHKF